MSHPHQLTLPDIVALAELVPTAASIVQVVEAFQLRSFNRFTVDTLKVIIRGLRCRCARLGTYVPRHLSLQGKKQALIDGLCAYIQWVSPECIRHSNLQPASAPCTCFSGEMPATNGPILPTPLQEVELLNSIKLLPAFQEHDGFQKKVRDLATAFLSTAYPPVRITLDIDHSVVGLLASRQQLLVARRFCPSSGKAGQFEPIDSRMSVKVSGFQVILPAYKAFEKPKKKPLASISAPLDLSPYIQRAGPLELMFASPVVTGIIAIQLLLPATIQEVVAEICGRERLPEHSDQKHDDDELTPSSMLVSLRCPLSMIRIRIPAKGLHCSHHQCFDLESMLAYCKQYSNWTCPVCSSPAPVADLRVDQFFTKLIAEAAEEVDQATISADGSVAYVDPEYEKRRLELQEERAAKRRRDQSSSVPISTQPFVPDPGLQNLFNIISEEPQPLYDGTSFDCPFVID